MGIQADIAAAVTNPVIKHYLNVFLAHFRERTGLSEVSLGSFRRELPYFRRANQSDVDSAWHEYVEAAKLLGVYWVVEPARTVYGQYIPESGHWTGSVLFMGNPLALGDWLVCGARENDPLTLVNELLAAYGTETILCLEIANKVWVNYNNGELKWDEPGIVYTYDSEQFNLTGAETAGLGASLPAILAAVAAVAKIAKEILDDSLGAVKTAKQLRDELNPDGSPVTDPNAPVGPPPGVLFGPNQPKDSETNPMFMIAIAAILANG